MTTNENIYVLIYVMYHSAALKVNDCTAFQVEDFIFKNKNRAAFLIRRIISCFFCCVDQINNAVNEAQMNLH